MIPDSFKSSSLSSFLKILEEFLSFQQIYRLKYFVVENKFKFNKTKFLSSLRNLLAESFVVKAKNEVGAMSKYR